MDSNDRNWMYRRWLGGGNLNPEFEHGVEMFLDFAFSQTSFVCNGQIVCPCNNCANRFSLERDFVKQHLYYTGFMPAYYIWAAHGEQTIPEHGYEFGSSSGISSGEHLGFRGMVYDVAGPHLETSPPCSSHHDYAEEEPNEEARVFYDLLNQEDQQLYPGYDGASPLYTTARMLNAKTSHNVLQIAFDEFASILKSVLPSQNKMSGSFYDAKKLMKKLGMGVEKILVCQNECMLYYKETRHLQECMHCRTLRYEVSISEDGSG